MRFFRSAPLILLLAVGVLAPAHSAEAQLVRFGAHVPLATGLGGGDDLTDSSWGVGARVGLEVPLFPVAAWGTFDWMFPGGDDTSYQNYGIDLNLRLPIPLLQPYATGGYQARRFDDGEVSDTYHGWTLGAGIRFSFIVNAFLEAKREFYGDDTALVGDDDQWMVRLGLIF